MSTVRLSDDWTSDQWLKVVNALDKMSVYQPDGNFAAMLLQHTRELHWRPPTTSWVAYDIGCAEGSFTRCWLDLLKYNFSLPTKLYLFEPQPDLLSTALASITELHPTIECLAVPERFESWMATGDKSVQPPDLVVLSHSCYYFRRLDLVFQQLLRTISPTGLLWLVARDRDCGLYQTRFSILARHGLEDTASHQFADTFHDSLSAARITDSQTDTERHWRSVSFPQSFSLLREHEQDNALEIFSFLAHLQLDKSSFHDAQSSNRDWYDFSETHILAKPMARSGANVSSTAMDILAGAEDRAALKLLEEAEQVLVSQDAIVLDMQLARFFHPSRLNSPRVQDETAPDNSLRPHRIVGSLLLWGQEPTKEVQVALAEYFKKHPTFLLYDTFFSPNRPNVVARTLGTFGRPPTPDRRTTRLTDERLGEVWHEQWDRSTFDIAWADWQAQLQLRWRNLPTGEDYELICMAVPARLGETNTALSVEEVTRVDSSAALFITGLYPTDSTSTGVMAESIDQAYAAIANLLQNYVGQTAAQMLQYVTDRESLLAAELFENRIRTQRHIIFNSLVPLSDLQSLKKRTKLSVRDRTRLADAWVSFSIVRVALSYAFGLNECEHPRDNLAGLIQWLVEHIFSSRFDAVITATITSPQYRFSSPQQCRDAFTLLWNIVDNATKKGPTRISFRLDKDTPVVECSNQGLMGDQYVYQIKGLQRARNDSGLHAALRAAADQDWTIQVSTDPAIPLTTVTVTMPGLYLTA